MRVYNRALTPAEITTDMNAAISNPDSIPPSAPGTLTATGASTSAKLNWGAATDNVGVVRYNVHRSTTAGFTPVDGEPDRAADEARATPMPVAAGTYYYKVTAEDAPAISAPASNEASTTVVTDTFAPTAPTSLRPGSARSALST